MIEEMDFNVLFALFLVFVGVFFCISARKMKKTKNPGTILFEKEELQICTKKDELAETLGNKLLPFGMVTGICGCADLGNLLFLGNRIVSALIWAAFLLCCVWFLSAFRQIRQKFFR